MKTYSPVETDNKEIEIVTDAKACAYCYLTIKSVYRELAWFHNITYLFVIAFIDIVVPNVAGIEKQCG